jgi:hypothetical protein
MFKLVALREERLERQLALAFGFMSFIPVLLLAYVLVTGTDLRTVVYAIVLSMFIGYFVVRRMVASVLAIVQKARRIAGDAVGDAGPAAATDEIGELARVFNRITGELEHKIDELQSSRQLVKQLLSRIGTAIVSYEGIDTILNLIVENTVGALEAQRGSLLLVDGERKDLYVKTAWSRNGAVANLQQRVTFDDSVAGWVAKEGRPLRGQGRAGALGFAEPPSAGPCPVLSVPLRLRDQPIGVLSVLREADQPAFTEDDESLIESIGSQMAVAIENYRLNLDVERTYVETIMALAMAVEAKDPYSAGHSKRVGYYAMKIGEQMGLDPETLRTLNDAGVLHDIGKIGVKDSILLKPQGLTPEEEEIMRQHPLIGEAILKPVRSLQKSVALVRHHHERFDGAGYPDGLRGDAIPLAARILAVADTYDAMVTDRPYRKRLSVDEAKAELRRHAGRQYDPAIVEAFLRVLDSKDQRREARRDPAFNPQGE